MTLYLLTYLAGVLTILSPCILPVLPFIFSRSDRPFLRNGLPQLFGMALTFAGVATLAAIGGSWAVSANQFGRNAALVLMGFFGLTLVLPSLASYFTKPLVALGERLSTSLGADSSKKEVGIGTSLLLGVATGLLWAPCAGPILGLVLSGAALNGANIQTSLLLLTYSAGAATSLGAALLVSGRLFLTMKRSLGLGEWIRRGLGASLLAGVAVISLGLDTGVLSQLSSINTEVVEQRLLDQIIHSQQTQAPHPPVSVKLVSKVEAQNTGMMSTGFNGQLETIDAILKLQVAQALPIESTQPTLTGAVQWLNSPPLTMESLRGKVVLIDFWTYSCINCLHVLPYVRAWAEKYKDRGLVVIGVHAPEFAYEKDIGNVRQALKDLQISYPVAIDNNFSIWRAFNNQYWPANYFIDAKGRVRYHHFGEGSYAESERAIQQLLAEAGTAKAPGAETFAESHRSLALKNAFALSVRSGNNSNDRVSKNRTSATQDQFL